MIHYVMIQFEKGTFTDEVYNDYQDSFAQMVWDYDDITEVCLKSGDILTDNSADMMIRVHLKNPDAISLFLTNEHHINLYHRHRTNIKNVMVFDLETELCDA